MPRLLAGVGAGLAVLLVAGCGGVQTTGEHKVAPAVAALHPPGPSSAPPAVAAEIRRTWAEFFDGTTSLHRRVQLLQDGRRFAAVLRAEARSPLASQASVTVSSVQLTGSTAVVHYALTVAGQPVPITQVGEAVHAGGSWKLSGATFCSLLAMTGAKLPAACPKAVQPSSSAVTFPPPAHG